MLQPGVEIPHFPCILGGIEADVCVFGLKPVIDDPELPPIASMMTVLGNYERSELPLRLIHELPRERCLEHVRIRIDRFQCHNFSFQDIN